MGGKDGPIRVMALRALAYRGFSFVPGRGKGSKDNIAAAVRATRDQLYGSGPRDGAGSASIGKRVEWQPRSVGQHEDTRTSDKH